MNAFNLGATYRVKKIDTINEIIPKTQLFKYCNGDKHVFEPIERKVPMFEVTQALETGIITSFDKDVLCVVGVFGCSFCTAKTIREMMIMMGKDFSDNVFESSLRRLCRYHLIAISHFVPKGKAPVTIKIISLTSYGSATAKALGVTHRFNALANSCAEAHVVKSRVQAAQLVCNYLKNVEVENFFIRPIKVVDADSNAIVRPALSMKIWGEQVYFEVPRRHDGYMEDLVDKLERYTLVFNNHPTVIINAEDSEMSLEIHKVISGKFKDMDIIFTDDLSTFGPNFKFSLYTFVDNEKVYFEMPTCEKVG